MSKSPLKIIVSLSCSFIIFTQVSCDPGWRYMLREPSSQQIRGKQEVQYQNLSIRTKAWYFSLGSNIDLEITTGSKMVSIVPQYAFVTSMADSNKNRIPYDVSIALTRNGKEIYNKIYTIKNRGEKKIQAITVNQWQKESTAIYYVENSQGRSINKRITKQEFLSPLNLQKGDTLKVHFRFIGFGSCSKSIGFDPPCQDITFHYNILKNNRSLELTFVSITNE